MTKKDLKKCPVCGKQLKRYLGKTTFLNTKNKISKKKEEGYVWSCQCSPKKIISVG